MALPTKARNNVTGAGRPRIHASDSARVVEFRSKNARLDVPISLPIGKTIEDLASQYGCSKAVVVRSLLRFALTNRDWRSQGLIWGD